MWVTRGGPPGRPLCYLNMIRRAPEAFPCACWTVLAAYCRPMVIPAIARCANRAVTGLAAGIMLGANSSKRPEPRRPLRRARASPVLAKADVALGYIGKLYAIEREQKERSDAERYQARQTRSMPLLAEFKTWLDNNVGKVMKGSLTRKAMEYTLGQWPHLGLLRAGRSAHQQYPGGERNPPVRRGAQGLVVRRQRARRQGQRDLLLVAGDSQSQ